MIDIEHMKAEHIRQLKMKEANIRLNLAEKQLSDYYERKGKLKELADSHLKNYIKISVEYDNHVSNYNFLKDIEKDANEMVESLRHDIYHGDKDE